MPAYRSLCCADYKKLVAAPESPDPLLLSLPSLPPLPPPVTSRPSTVTSETTCSLHKPRSISFLYPIILPVFPLHLPHNLTDKKPLQWPPQELLSGSPFVGSLQALTNAASST